MHHRSSIEKLKVVFNRAINKYWSSPFTDIKSQINWRSIKWVPKTSNHLGMSYIVSKNDYIDVKYFKGKGLRKYFCTFLEFE